MPFQPGHKHSPGRKKGSKNRNNQSVQEAVERIGINVFETLLLFAQGNHIALGYSDEKPITQQMRLQAVESACKYLYTPRPPSREPEDTPDENQEVQELFGWLKQLKEMT